MTERVVLAQIEERAKDATEGPWGAVPGLSSADAFVRRPGRGAHARGMTNADANYIAAVDPPTVEAMAAALRIAHEGLTESLNGDGGAASATLVALRDLVDFSPAPTRSETEGDDGR